MPLEEDITEARALLNAIPADALRAVTVFAERVLRGESVKEALVKTAEILTAEAVI